MPVITCDPVCTNWRRFISASGDAAPPVFCSFSMRRLRLHLVEYLLEVQLLLAYILDLLRTRRFALDGHSALVAKPVQLGEDTPEIHQAFANQHLFAELAGVGGPLAVLGMNAAHVRAKDIDCVNRIRLAVQDKICRV